jgi:cytochrome c biogenesis protein CcdA
MGEWLLGTASALWLGILTSVSPCPLATNITAISYVGRRVKSPQQVFLAGVLYTLGRSLTYVVLGVLLVNSILSMPYVSNVLQKYMNKLLGPILILVGMFLLEMVRINLPGSGIGEGMQRRVEAWGIWGSAALGVIFALSFCPVSAALFFGSLVPLAIKGRIRCAATVALWSRNRASCAHLRGADRTRGTCGRQGVQHAGFNRTLGTSGHGSYFHYRWNLLLPDVHLWRFHVRRRQAPRRPKPTVPRPRPAERT